MKIKQMFVLKRFWTTSPDGYYETRCSEILKFAEEKSELEDYKQYCDNGNDFYLLGREITSRFSIFQSERLEKVQFLNRPEKIDLASTTKEQRRSYHERCKFVKEENERLQGEAYNCEKEFIRTLNDFEKEAFFFYQSRQFSYEESSYEIVEFKEVDPFKEKTNAKH